MIIDITTKKEIKMDRTLTEAMLSDAYAENGVVVKDLSDVKQLLRKKGFFPEGNSYKSKIGKRAYVYKIRDAVMGTGKEVLYYVPKGWIVSFGGEPKSCYELKFTKIVRPMV